MNWVWKRSTMDSANASIDVTAAGLQTFNLYMREDGASIDRILLTTDNSYTPTGSGPVMSTRGIQQGPTVDAGFAVSGNGSLSLDATVTDDGQGGDILSQT